MKNHDELIKSILLKDNKILTNSIRKLNKGKYPNILGYLKERYNDSDSINETIRRIQCNVEIRPICPVCSGHVSFNGYYNGMMHYCKCCCSSCNAKHTKEKRYKTNIERYGRVNFGSEHKVKETWLSKYDVNNPAKAKEVKDKMKKTCIERYGVNCASKSDMVKQKMKDTCFKKYGVSSVFQLDVVKNKIKKTCLERYGVESVAQSKVVKNKIKKTCLERYGVESAIQSKYVKEKSKKTMMNKYGVEYSMQIPKNKEYMSYLMSSKEMQDRRYEVMKRNHTFNISKPEEELYLYIKSKFPSVKRQYKDKKRYPYNCDFYIPELDYFIELQGYYTHGKHPFDPNSKEDLQLVEQYKNKYGPNCQAITIWTIKDIEKRNCAKEYNLNFKEVWTLDEGKGFINYIYNNQKLIKNGIQYK